MSRTIKEIIEESLTCIICLETFQNPKVLKCLHTFCETCVLATIQQQRITGHNISCPICRKRIETTPHEELELQTNYPIKNLLDVIQDLPNNEYFEQLYRVNAGLNLDQTLAIALAEKGQCKYLESSNDELRRAVIDLRRELTEEENTCYELIENIDELQEVISDLRKEISEEKKHNRDLQVWNNTLQTEISNLKRERAEVQRDLEELVDKQKNMSLVSWMRDKFKMYIEMSVSWLPVWFKSKQGENKNKHH